MAGAPAPDAGPKSGGKAEGTSDGHAGHRERLRRRFLEGGADAMPDYELLELLLFQSIPRRDTKPVAKRLIDRFGSFAGVLSAPVHVLSQETGVSETAAANLRVVAAAATRLARQEMIGADALTSWEKVLAFCRADMARMKIEHFRVLFLDKRNAVLHDEVQQRGTIDHTPVYPREVIKRALELGASAIILVHNHPSGDPKPSRADIDMTKAIERIGKDLGIVLHDHLVISRSGHVSFRAMGLL